MSEELWMYVDEEVKSVAENTFHLHLISPHEGSEGKTYGYTKLWGWANKSWEERQSEHAYENPWKEGWAVFAIRPENADEEEFTYEQGQPLKIKWVEKMSGQIIVSKFR